MMMKNKIKDIHEWVGKVNESSKLIIVEGKKDRKSLQDIGITNDIIFLNKPLYEIVENVAESSKQVIILTDFDKKGKELYGKLKRDLCKYGIKIDNKFREWLQRNTKLSHIEGIKHFHNTYK